MWLAKLGSELEASPMTQLMFSAAMASVVLGLVSAWPAVLRFLAAFWWALLIALAVTFFALQLIKGYSARTSRSRADEHLAEAGDHLAELLRHHPDGVFYERALGHLEIKYSYEADHLLRGLLASGFVQRGYDDRLKMRGGDDGRGG